MDLKTYVMIALIVFLASLAGNKVSNSGLFRKDDLKEEVLNEVQSE